MDEFSIIKNFIKTVKDDAIILGHGDDCSVIDYSENQFLIQTTDCLVEDVHFRFSNMSWSELAYKSLAVNISDIAAMGGTPRWAHMTLATSTAVEDSQLTNFFHHFYKLAESKGISLIGGDISRSPGPTFINIGLTGLVNKENIQYRHSFKEGADLCVTGNLGSSALGFFCLENNLINEKTSYFVE